jgi:hypothetical protein
MAENHGPHEEVHDQQPGVAAAYAGSPMWLHATPWAEATREVLAARLGPIGDVDFTQEALRACETTMRDLGYVAIERWEESYYETIDVDFVVGHILSATSAEQIPLAAREDLEGEIRSAFQAVAPSGTVSEPITVRAVIASTEREGS